MLHADKKKQNSDTRLMHQVPKYSYSVCHWLLHAGVCCEGRGRRLIQWCTVLHLFTRSRTLSASQSTKKRRLFWYPWWNNDRRTSHRKQSTQRGSNKHCYRPLDVEAPDRAESRYGTSMITSCGCSYFTLLYAIHAGVFNSAAGFSPWFCIWPVV